MILPNVHYPEKQNVVKRLDYCYPGSLWECKRGWIRGEARPTIFWAASYEIVQFVASLAVEPRLGNMAGGIPIK